MDTQLVFRRNDKRDIFTFQQWIITLGNKEFSIRQFRNSKHNRDMKRVGFFEAYDFNTQGEDIFKTLEEAKTFIKANGGLVNVLAEVF